MIYADDLGCQLTVSAINFQRLCQGLRENCWTCKPFDVIAMRSDVILNNVLLNLLSEWKLQAFANVLTLCSLTFCTIRIKRIDVKIYRTL